METHDKVYNVTVVTVYVVEEKYTFMDLWKRS